MFELTRPCFHKQNNCVKSKNCPFFPQASEKLSSTIKQEQKLIPPLSSSVVVIAFQIIFCAEMHANDFIYFKKKYF
jgi:hypothetical protein